MNAAIILIFDVRRTVSLIPFLQALIQRAGKNCEFFYFRENDFALYFIGVILKFQTDFEFHLFLLYSGFLISANDVTLNSRTYSLSTSKP